MRTGILLLTAALSLAFVSAAIAQQPKAADAKKPNIVVIWGDDIGVHNISAYNHGIMGYKTPNIDRIAKEGAEDLDCSGLPVSDETICTYDEGFISGLLSAHTGGKFKVKEVDCWRSGDRVCRFDVRPA